MNLAAFARRSRVPSVHNANARPLPGAWLFVGAATAAMSLQPMVGVAKEACWTAGPAQFADAVHYCVSSVLPPQGGLSYGPRNLADGDLQTAWCEGARGPGVGETITIRIDGGPQFRRLIFYNGYAKSVRNYRDNGRIKTIDVTSDTGVSARATLADHPGEQHVALPGLAHRWIKLQIVDVYPGARFADTCVDLVSPDFEYENELLQRGARPGSAPTPSRSAPVGSPSVAAAPPPAKAEIAFDTDQLGQTGTLVLHDLMPLIGETPRLDREVVQALAEVKQKEHKVICIGMRFSGQWKHLAGDRVSPYTCKFAENKWLQIRATVHLTDRSGSPFEKPTPRALQNATNVTETDLNWKWTSRDPSEGQ